MAIGAVVVATALVAAAVMAMVAAGGDDGAAATHDDPADLATAPTGPAEDEGDDGADDGGDGTGAMLPAEIPPFTEAPDGGELQVVESGMSVFTDEVDGERLLTWGVVLENTSDHVATWTDLRVHAVDTAGERVATGRPRRPVRTETIAMVPPGARFAIGHTTLLLGAEPADLDIDISGSQWVPPDAAGVVFPTLEATEPAVEPFDVDGTRLGFEVNSSLDEELRVQVSAVMRDSAGEVVGGLSRENCYSGYFDVEAGTNSRNVGYPFVLPADASYDVSIDPAAIPMEEE